MTWFYFHCVLAVVILIADYNGTLEPTLNRLEESFGIRTEVMKDTLDTKPPYYIPPIEEREESGKEDNKSL